MVRAAQSDLAQRLGHAPTSEQLAEVTELDADVVNSALVSISSNSSHGSAIVSPIVPSSAPCDEFDEIDTSAALRSTVRTLSERERLILSLRFDHEMTQEQIGTRLGVSQMQVSRTLARVFACLRERLQDEGPGGEPPDEDGNRQLPVEPARRRTA